MYSMKIIFGEHRGYLEMLGETADLNEFLFGSERAALAVVRPALLDIQRGSASTVMHHLRERQPTSITSPRGLGIG
jgi:hypothetical protein